MKYKYSICPFCDKVNNERNRMISIRSPWAPVSINYVLRKLFVMLGLPSEDIKEKKTPQCYHIRNTIGSLASRIRRRSLKAVRRSFLPHERWGGLREEPNERLRGRL